MLRLHEEESHAQIEGKGFSGRGHVNAKALRTERSQEEQQRGQCGWSEEIKGQINSRGAAGGGWGMGNGHIMHPSRPR